MPRRIRRRDPVIYFPGDDEKYVKLLHQMGLYNVAMGVFYVIFQLVYDLTIRPVTFAVWISCGFLAGGAMILTGVTARRDKYVNMHYSLFNTQSFKSFFHVILNNKTKHVSWKAASIFGFVSSALQLVLLVVYFCDCLVYTANCYDCNYTIKN